MAKLSELLQTQQDQADMLRKISELPGLNRATAQAATLQNQPMAATGMLAPADQTPFGEMRQLSPQELAARGTAIAPSRGMQNPNLRGANFDRVVPYYAAQGMQQEGWNISPEMVKEYQRAGINKLVSQGGNYEVNVGHEGSHDQIWDEMANRKFTAERYAGTPNAALAEAQYKVKDETNPEYQAALKAAYPAFGNPKYAEVRATLEKYKKAK